MRYPPVTLRLALLGIFIVGSSAHSFATVSNSAESLAAYAIATGTEEYQKDHAGALPKEWNDFGKDRIERIEERLPHLAPTKRYAFISPPVMLPKPLHGELVAMNRRAIYEPAPSPGVLAMWSLRGPGRYIIYRTPGHTLSYAWVVEDYVQQAFAAAAAHLPEPDHEPERKWVIEARRSIYFWRSFCAGIVLLFTMVLWKRHARRNRFDC